jgi:hypothetical protein
VPLSQIVHIKGYINDHHEDERMCLVMLVTKRDKWESTFQG